MRTAAPRPTSTSNGRASPSAVGRTAAMTIARTTALQRRARRHRGEERAQSRSQQASGARCLRCSRFPVQEPPLCDDQAHQGQHDRVHHLLGVVGKQNERQECLREGVLRFLHDAAHVDARGLALANLMKSR